ncbi:MAG: hypothetical protein KKA73_29265 [Chloroflexi bacterium]|nr:hypothetical protein [Chloroflexota bacterium]MBU1751786.1 hypothetical protein [Chloroflexota bacterium]
MPSRDDGQALFWVILGLLIVLIVGAGTLDVYQCETTRAGLYQVAAEASLIGVSRGRDWSYYTVSGQWALDNDVAYAEAWAAAQMALAQRNLTAVDLQIAVLPDPSGGVVAEFPPVPRADLGQASDWSTDEPAVAVYIAADVSTTFFGWINASDHVTVHVFSAAGLAALQP